tara:strand:+ start:450 stop:1211 length:762 start_codon:yes stop_codon:yes gene_type:complete
LKKNNFIVYTALFGKYDELLEPVPSAHCDYVCFTDDPLLKSNVWEVRVVSSHLSENMMNRLYKIKPHVYFPNYKASIYIDSNIKILKDPVELFNKYLEKSNFLAIKHMDRNCLYAEALVCIAEKKTDYILTLNQMFSYSSEGYPANNSLSENRILIRTHNEKEVVSIMEMWWDQLNTWTQRDQLSLCYVAWKLKYKIGFISENPRLENDYFKWFPHKENEKRILARLIRKLKFLIRWVLIYPYYTYRIGFIKK